MFIKNIIQTFIDKEKKNSKKYYKIFSLIIIFNFYFYLQPQIFKINLYILNKFKKIKWSVNKINLKALAT